MLQRRCISISASAECMYVHTRQQRVKIKIALNFSEKHRRISQREADAYKVPAAVENIRDMHLQVHSPAVRYIKQWRIAHVEYLGYRRDGKFRKGVRERNQPRVRLFTEIECYAYSYAAPRPSSFRRSIYIAATRRDSRAVRLALSISLARYTDVYIIHIRVYLFCIYARVFAFAARRLTLLVAGRASPTFNIRAYYIYISIYIHTSMRLTHDLQLCSPGDAAARGFLLAGLFSAALYSVSRSRVFEAAI